MKDAHIPIQASDMTMSDVFSFSLRPSSVLIAAVIGSRAGITLGGAILPILRADPDSCSCRIDEVIIKTSKYILGLRDRVVRICVREVSLTLVSFTHLMNVCGSAYENGAWSMTCVLGSIIITVLLS